jgi:monofunctional glycosyltransferase
MPSKLIAWFLVGFFIVLLGAGWVAYDIFVAVPDFSKLKDSVEVPIKLANGDKTTRLMGPRTAGWTPLSGMSEFLPRAVVSSEDGTFYQHKGIDVYEMQEAFKKDLKEGRFARGASTITQQVLKNVYLLRMPKIWRKVKEIAWASKLEAALSKPQILAFYLNMAEWGPGIYGIGEASRHYFSTSPSNLTARQSAFLAMLLPSPKRYHAYFRQKRLTQWAANRVNRILQVMNKLGQLPDDQLTVAVNERLWGQSVLPDGSPGAPVDPGWDVSETVDEVFEPAGGKSSEVPAEAPMPALSLSPSAPKTASPSEPAAAGATDPLAADPSVDVQKLDSLDSDAPSPD